MQVMNMTFLPARSAGCARTTDTGHVHYLHTVHIFTFLIPFFLPVLLCWWCARARQQPAASLSPPSLSRRCLSCHLFNVSRCSCLFIQRLALLVLVRPAAVVLAENSRGRGRISMHSAEPLGRCVFCTLAVPTSPHFHVGKHKHTVS